MDPRRYSSQLEPYPAGWYCLGFSSELAAGAVRTQVLAGRELVVFRTEAGKAAVVDAHCPHLGAHLGHGGTVEGETIRCPFHGFCFDTAGACTKTGYGSKPPPKARLGAWPVAERMGALFAYFDPRGQRPTWELPEVDMTGWTRLRHRTMRLRSHPQEVAENSVDVGHFAHIHGYADVRVAKELSTEGPYLNVRYEMRRQRRGLAAFRDIGVAFEIHQHGLGCAFVEARTSLGLLGRQLILVTPVSDDQIDLRIANAVRIADERSWVLGLLPVGLLGRIAFREFERDVRQDLVIWNNKRYFTPPALAVGDGPVGVYRRWARQFYGDEAPQARHLTVTGGVP